MWLRGFPLLWGCFQGDRLGQNGDFDLAYKVEDDFHCLPAVSGGLVRFVDNDLLHKFVHDGSGQLGDIHVLIHQSGEAVVVVGDNADEFPPMLQSHIARIDGRVEGIRLNI